MNSMFANCNNLLSLDLSSFDLTNIIDHFNIFSNCFNLTLLFINKKSLDKMPNIFDNINIILKS